MQDLDDTDDFGVTRALMDGGVLQNWRQALLHAPSMVDDPEKGYQRLRGRCIDAMRDLSDAQGHYRAFVEWANDPPGLPGFRATNTIEVAEEMHALLGRLRDAMIADLDSIQEWAAAQIDLSSGPC